MIARGYQYVRNEYSFNPSIAKENKITQAKYTEILSSFGLLYDFLKVGINQNKSINIINITDINGWFKINQKNIAINHKNKLILSIFLISFSHFLSAIKTIEKQNSASNKVT